MVRRCVACGKFADKGGNSFHCFPKDLERKRLWMRILELSEDSPKVQAKHAVVCSDHFPSYCFRLKPSGLKYLVANTLPCPNSVKLEPVTISYDSVSSLNTECGDKENKTLLTSENQIIFEEKDRFSPSINTSLCTISPVIVEVYSIPEIINESKDEIDIDKYTLSPGAASTTSSTTLTASPSIHDFSPATEVESLSENEIDFEPPPERCTLSPEAASATSSTALAASPPTLNFTTTAETTCQSGNELNCEQPPKKKKFVYPRYFGDWQNSDMSNPVIVERNWKIAQQTIARQRKKIRTLQQTNRRLQARLVCLKTLVRQAPVQGDDTKTVMELLKEL